MIGVDVAVEIGKRHVCLVNDCLESHARRLRPVWCGGQGGAYQRVGASIDFCRRQRRFFPRRGATGD
jgi:hypothetical protein